MRIFVSICPPSLEHPIYKTTNCHHITFLFTVNIEHNWESRRRDVDMLLHIHHFYLIRDTWRHYPKALRWWAYKRFVPLNWALHVVQIYISFTRWIMKYSRTVIDFLPNTNEYSLWSLTSRRREGKREPPTWRHPLNERFSSKMYIYRLQKDSSLSKPFKIQLKLSHLYACGYLIHTHG